MFIYSYFTRAAGMAQSVQWQGHVLGNLAIDPQQGHRAWDFSVLPNVQTGYGAHHTYYSFGTRPLFPERRVLAVRKCGWPVSYNSCWSKEWVGLHLHSSYIPSCCVQGQLSRKILGSCYSVVEALTLLGCYVAYICSRLPMFQDKLSSPPWRVEQSLTVPEKESQLTWPPAQ